MTGMESAKEFVSGLTREDKWHGNHNENSKQLILRAGKLSMVYENGDLRYISAKNFELVRMIYSAVRGRGWLTIKPVISGEKFDIKADSFFIKYTAHYLSGEINFLAHYSITGNADNSLIFILEGEALGDFEKNRIGFCVLHPVEGFKGENCEIVNTGNKAESLVFPFFISPHQPFADIKSMLVRRTGISCRIDFYGDVFETEDQRNWTDSSYKTYCTPLGRAYPVTVQKGEKVSQKIELKVLVDDISENIESGQVSISIDTEKIRPFPMIGIGRSTRPAPLTEGEVRILKRIPFDHYRIDVYLFRNDWKAQLKNGLNEAASLGYKVELALFFDDNFDVQIGEFLKLITALTANIAVVLLFHRTFLSTPDVLIDNVAPLLKGSMPLTTVGFGTNANFAQLNRKRPETGNADYICYSIHPQEHASDNMTLVENLQAQRDSVESAASFSNKKEIWVSPVNIQRRFNANTSTFEPFGEETDFPPQVDSRLMSLFGGCWTAGSLKHLISGGIKGVTYFETVGERGIIQGDFNSRWPDNFRSCKGMIFPVYHIFKFILEGSCSGIAECTSSHPLNVDALVITVGTKLRMVLVNYMAPPQKVTFKGYPGEIIIKSLNEKTYLDAVSDPGWLEKAESTTIPADGIILLEPFSISFIEG
jgi:D-apionolactonase